MTSKAASTGVHSLGSGQLAKGATRQAEGHPPPSPHSNEKPGGDRETTTPGWKSLELEKGGERHPVEEDKTLHQPTLIEYLLFAEHDAKFFSSVIKQ